MTDSTLTNATANGASITVDHVADTYRCYPGEVVKLMTRVVVHEPVDGFEVRVQLPYGAEIDHYRASSPGTFPIFYQLTQQTERVPEPLPGAHGEPFPLTVTQSTGQITTQEETTQQMIWRVEEPQEEGATYHYEADLLVLPTHRAKKLRSEATLFGAVQDESGRLGIETVEIQVEQKSRYMAYLPALYEQDEFMGRFLMLFESFWGPIEEQIDQVENYFDPDLTPVRFLPWLASWFDLTLDGTWNETQQRELIRSVIWLYRRRGTRVALQRYLEILTQQPVDIEERRAENFSLGNKARLGVGVALGTENVPHTFSVRVRMEAISPPAGLTEEAATREVERLERERRVLLTRLIDAEKPAHTSYQLEFIPVED